MDGEGDNNNSNPAGDAPPAQDNNDAAAADAQANDVPVDNAQPEAADQDMNGGADPDDGHAADMDGGAPGNVDPNEQVMPEPVAPEQQQPLPQVDPAHDQPQMNLQPEMQGQPHPNYGIDPSQQINPEFLGGQQPGMGDFGGLDDSQGVNPNGMFNGDNLVGAGQDMGGAGDEDVDDYFDDAGDIGYLPADHPLMARLQAALTKQLTDEHERVDLQLREKEEERRKVRQERDDTGVQMYGVQHQLAKMQTKFERIHDNYNIVNRFRKDAEAQHEQLQRQYETKKEEADDQLKRVLKAQEELNQLNRTLKQVEEYNEVMKSEIAVTRRTTYRAEESVVNLEKQKKGQDVLIDSMNEEIKRLNEQKTLYQAQLISQKEETAAARNTLKEAAIQIERIVGSKKTLLDDWQKALFGMQQRDKALQVIKELIKRKEDEIQQIQSEIAGVRNETKREQDTSENLMTKLQKMEADQQFLEERQADIENERRRLEEQHNMLKASIMQTETESGRMDSEKDQVQDKMSTLEKSIMSLHTKTKEIRDDIINHASQQKTIEKSSANLLKQTKKIYQSIAKKEIEIEDQSNEIARVRIDNLNCTQQNELLKQKKKELMLEFADKEKEVRAFEAIIKTGHKAIDMKQLKVDRLNRKVAQLKESGRDENSGPMEANRNNLEKQKNEVDEKIVQVQKQWITNQTDFIMKQNQHMELSGDCKELITRKSIYEQKKLRLNNQVQVHQKEIRQLEVAKKNLDGEMGKLNDLLHNNKNQREKLKKQNVNTQQEFKQKLRDLENESIRLENNISSLKDQKAQILADIVEYERQVLLWERKIQLEKEMQDALDPTIGQTEIVAMKKEIHRMELRYEQLRKKQEEMIKDMERSVFKRETIQLKYLPKVEKTNAQDKSSQGKLSRQIANLKQTLKHTTENTMKLDQSIDQRVRELEEISKEIRANRDVQDQEEQMNTQNYYQLLAAKMLKARAQYQTIANQQKAKGFNDVAVSRFRPQFTDGEQANNFLEQNRSKNMMVEEVLLRIKEQNPDLQQILDNMIGW